MYMLQQIIAIDSELVRVQGGWSFDFWALMVLISEGHIFCRKIMYGKLWFLNSNVALKVSTTILYAEAYRTRP